MESIDELGLLLDKISTSETFIEKAEEFYAEKSGEWSDGLRATFEIFLEKKRDQIYYEAYLAERMGWDIALGRPSRGG